MRRGVEAEAATVEDEEAAEEEAAAAGLRRGGMAVAAATAAQWLDPRDPTLKRTTSVPRNQCVARIHECRHSPHRRRRDDEQGPVLAEVVHDGDGLNGFAQAHVVPDEAAPVLPDGELDAFALERQEVPVQVRR